jgi:hypothetical protein
VKRAKALRSTGATESPGRVLHRLTRAGAAISILLLVSLAYNWNYLRLGFEADDVVFLEIVQQDPLPYPRGLGMWATDEMTAITNLWWFEGQSTTAFFRPVPSLVFEGMVLALGERAVPFHLFSVLLHGLVAGSIFLLVRRLTGRAHTALLAGVVFLSFEDHSMGVAVITMMTDPLAVLFVNLALLAYAAWLSSRRFWCLIGSLALLVPAFLSKESAVLAPVAMILMALLLPAGREPASPPSDAPNPRRRLKTLLRDWHSWAPALAMLIGYLIVYRALGFGGLSSGMYTDPLAHPLRYLGRLLVHLPVMWLATLSPVPPSLTWFSPELMVPFAVAGLVAFAVWVLALWPLRGSGLVLWAGAFYVLALLPQMSAGASERALYFPAVAASILLALLVERIGFVARRLAPDSSPAARPTRVGGWLALVVVLVPGVLLSATMPFAYLPSFQKLGRDAITAVPHIAERQPKHVVILNTPGSMHCFYMQPTLEHQVGRALDVRVLSSMNGIMSVEPAGERELLVHTDRAGWLTNPFASALARPGAPRLGKVFEEELFTATPVALTEDQTDVATVHFRMNLSLDDPSVLILAWDGTAFVPFDPTTKEAGQETLLADTSDVWASMW